MFWLAEIVLCSNCRCWSWVRGFCPGGFNQTGTSAVAGDRWLGGHFLYSLQQCQLPQFRTELSLHFHYRSSSSSCWLVPLFGRPINGFTKISRRNSHAAQTRQFFVIVWFASYHKHTHGSLLFCRLAQLTHSKINIEINIYLGTLFPNQWSSSATLHTTAHLALVRPSKIYSRTTHPRKKSRARCCWFSLP